MYRIFLLITGLIFIVAPTMASDFPINNPQPTIEELYAYPQGKNKSEAIIFYNSNLPYQNQNDVINKTYTFIKENYPANLQLYVIDVAQDMTYLHFFKLTTTISLALAKIQDSAALGYKTMENLQAQIEEPEIYKQQLREFIDNFLIYE